MSDILIKNMDKPKACFTPLCKESCYFHISAWEGLSNYCSLTGNKVKCNKVDKDCPIVEVRPHKDLIDRDELLSDIKERGEAGILDYNDPTAVVSMILSAQTVLEESE